MHCPVCNKIITWEDNPFRPFCSERCKMVDLGEWMDEGYRIAGEGHDDKEPVKKTPDEDT